MSSYSYIYRFRAGCEGTSFHAVQRTGLSGIQTVSVSVLQHVAYFNGAELRHSIVFPGMSFGTLEFMQMTLFTNYMHAEFPQSFPTAGTYSQFTADWYVFVII